MLTNYPTFCQQFALPSSSRPRVFRKTSNRGHLVGKWAQMCKILLFGAGWRVTGLRPLGACDARPGLLWVRFVSSGAVRSANAFRCAPNGNILRIWEEKTTTCCCRTKRGMSKTQHAAGKTDLHLTHDAQRIATKRKQARRVGYLEPSSTHNVDKR